MDETRTPFLVFSALFCLFILFVIANTKLEPIHSKNKNGPSLTINEVKLPKPVDETPKALVDSAGGIVINKSYNTLSDNYEFYYLSAKTKTIVHVTEKALWDKVTIRDSIVVYYSYNFMGDSTPIVDKFLNVKVLKTNMKYKDSIQIYK